MVSGEGIVSLLRKEAYRYVRLNLEPSARKVQPVACGIDPGSKKEGLVLASAAHTYLNIQADAVTWVKDAEAQSTRRGRKTPCRHPRPNRRPRNKKLPPSAKARWQWKLRLARFLCRLFPISVFVVEDIAAVTRKSKRRWNRSFSPLEVGKHWFSEELRSLASLRLLRGYETKALHEQLGLKKTRKKTAEVWEAHAVDAWCLAYSVVGGKRVPDNRRLICLSPLQWHRRQLHRLEAERGGKRKPYGGTLSLGLKRGTLVKHPKWGLAYVGGTMEGRISLHDPQTGKRLTQTAKVADCHRLAIRRWRMRLLPLHPAATKGTPASSPD